MITFKANWRGICEGCKEIIRPGDIVAYDNNKLRHARCFGLKFPTLDPDELEVCKKCFLTSCDCED